MTPDDYKNQCRLRCYHEAGHLVYGLIHNQIPKSAFVSPNLTLSFVKWNDTIPISDSKIKRGSSLAGIATECRFCLNEKLDFILSRLRNHTYPRIIEGAVSKDLEASSDLSDEELADFIEQTFSEQYFEKNSDLTHEFSTQIGRKRFLNADEIQVIYKHIRPVSKYNCS